MFISALAVFACLGSAAAAQENSSETLADVRAQLLELYGQMEALRRELIPSAARPRKIAPSDISSLRRIDALEQELRESFAKVEELEFRILRIAEDGNRQIRDLEFVLMELAGKDLSQLTLGSPLGEELGPASTVFADAPAETVVADFSALEEEGFNRAMQAYQKGEIQSAIEQFAQLTTTYPEGMFVADAHYYRGEALYFQEKWLEAGKAFLAAFSHQDDGPAAAKSMLRLGESLIELGQTNEACTLLKDVGARFPNTGEAGLAEAQLANLDCD